MLDFLMLSFLHFVQDSVIKPGLVHTLHPCVIHASNPSPGLIITILFGPLSLLRDTSLLPVSIHLSVSQYSHSKLPR